MKKEFKPCSIDGCSGNSHRSANGATGLCCSHYKRKRATGDPLGSTKKEAPALNWLKSILATDSRECITWPYSRNPQGYGYVRVNQKTRLAHRVVCEMVYGKPKDGMDACHSCGKGHEGCVNPNHLRWDTRSGNFKDKLLHGTDARGEKSPVSKLTDEDVREIRRLRGLLTQKNIAAQYGIDPSNVSKIQNGISWREY